MAEYGFRSFVPSRESIVRRGQTLNETKSTIRCTGYPSVCSVLQRYSNNR